MCGRNNNLTNIYYAKELLSYLKHRHLKHVWQEFINRPAEQQLLEEVATLAAQWFQPDKNISYLHIESHLDKIAQQVMEHLKSVNPNHPIFLALREQFLFWKCHNIDENHWDNSDGRQILDSLCKILFFELNFRAVGYGEIGRRRTAHAFIHSVLEMKVGKALPLAIIFQSVARRLGIRCDLLSFPVILANSWGYSYWLLRWKPKWNLNPNDEECFYINVLHRGIILDNNWSRICEVAKCTIRSDSYCRVNTFELLLEISYYYAVSVDCFLEATIVRSFKGVAYVTDKICWFSRLLDLIKREKGYLTTFEFYIRDKDTILKFIQRVQKVQSNALNEKGWTKLARDTVTGMVSVVCKKDKCRLKRKKRKAGMKFAVGMIVRILSSNKIGVIIRWEKLELSLRTKKSSLYYTVLCDCKKTHCVPEENLRRVVKSIRIPINTDITGIYFSTFKAKLV
ncbi:uncharacterized protein LOC105278883 isoform X2 [Ooceraea biroi]|uniref:uncharacterized protein LOC105278883 isoform X2 n=1 Tax=Ooceraea biroi TaxID=2015173 RepID=UPI000F07F1F2|nr:uncharacterized protein LOC105278883 isoform X2 [Ooceraea biroi]